MPENKEHNMIDRAVVFVKRQLTLLQEIYLKYFNRLLKKYKVESPAELCKEDRVVFFQEVEVAWKAECEQRKKEIEKEGQENQKKLQLKVEVAQAPIFSVIESETSLEVEGIENDKVECNTIDSNEEDDELSSAIDKNNTLRSRVQDKGSAKRKEVVNAFPKSKSQDSSSHENTVETAICSIASCVNPEQTDNLRIGYHPNSFFAQANHYSYPVVKMPKESAFLKLPRKGRAMGKGYKESDFYKAILTHIPEVEVAIDLHLAIPYYNKPYEPDIVLINSTLNLYIDIEIDETYDGYYRYPIHNFDQDEKTNEVTKKDDTRDLFFTESGWVVIRFTERQVHLQEAECIAYIKDVLHSIVNYRFVESSSCVSELQWDYQQAIRWEKAHYREKYLAIEKFGKQSPTSKIVVDVNQTESIENNITRTKKFESASLQDNVAFEDKTHIYHHAKDETGNASYISVTTLIERFFPFDMERFITTKAQQEERSEEEVLIEFLRLRDEASAKGTYLHEQIEYFLKGKPHDADSEEFKMFKVFYQQIVVDKGFEFVDAEKKVLLDDYNVAGTIDALFKKPGKEEYIIVDWKRSKKLLVDGHPKKYGYGYALSELSYLDNSSYYKYALQQNIYKYMLEKKCGLTVSSMNLIVLHEKFDRYYRIDLQDMAKEVAIIFNSINHKI